jgi:aryl-alcohol dehydrogenase-like predicted oxidoreductase
MDKRRIGRSDLSVAPFCLGGNVFGWTADEATSFAILDRFVEQGFDFVDTADVYSIWAPGHRGGESEAVIGRWLAARPGARDRIVLATKVGMDMREAGKGLSAAHIERSCEASLRRLGTDRIDLYQSHLDDADVPLEETLTAHDRLVRAGKVRVLGASNYEAGRLAEALAVSQAKGLARYECLQPEYSLAARGYEAELEPLCRSEQIGVIGYFSLAAGFLTGKYREAGAAAGRARENRVAPYLNARGFALLAVLDAVAAEHGASPAQVALAWIIARPGITAPIASATSVAQLDELLGAVRLRLPAEAIARLDEASAGGISDKG